MTFSSIGAWEECLIRWYPLLFAWMMYSFAGWCLEVLYAAVHSGKFVNRGFLNGPFCPIYGFGMLGIDACSAVTGGAPGAVFFWGMVLATSLELISGLILRWVFHTRWWDYSDCPFNFKGYICLEFSIVWGLTAVLAEVLVARPVNAVISSIPPETGIWFLLPALGLFLADLTVTLTQLWMLPKKLRLLTRLEEILRKPSDLIGGKILYQGYEQAAEKSRALRRAYPELDETERRTLRKILRAKKEVDSSIKEQENLTRENLEKAREELRRQIRQFFKGNAVGRRIGRAFPALLENENLKTAVLKEEENAGRDKE